MSILKTVCFSGYRPEKFPFSLEAGTELYETLRFDIQEAIQAAICDGYDTFLCGMAKGFDLLCGSTTLAMRTMNEHINLVAVLPYANHGFKDERWGGMHQAVADGANEILTVAPRYCKNSYQQRNKHMIGLSSRLICYWDGH